jgi:hypothetical protein
MAHDELDRLRGRDHGNDPRVADLRRRIADIIKLSHSGEPDDMAQYRDRQAELRDLVAELTEAEQGDLADATIVQVDGEWRIKSGTQLLDWKFADRRTAARFLEQLKREQQPKDIPQ